MVSHYTPGFVASGFGFKAVTLRAWHTAGLRTDADERVAGSTGHRRYSFEDVVQIGIVANLTGAGRQAQVAVDLATAIRAANAARPHIAAAIEAARGDDPGVTPVLIIWDAGDQWRVACHTSWAEFVTQVTDRSPMVVIPSKLLLLPLRQHAAAAAHAMHRAHIERQPITITMSSGENRVVTIAQDEGGDDE